MVVLTLEQLEQRLAALHQASLQLVSNLSLEKVLEQIVQLAREQANARYAALGVVDENGKLVKFIPVGLQPEQAGKIAHPPVGKGLLGLFHKEGRPIRLADISSDPRSAGFPPNHPKMKSFLGVPIISGERTLGQIYLTDKLDADEFNENDERVIETLAAYAAVAITNASLYEKLARRSEELTQRNEDLALLNETAAALTRSLDVDEIIKETLVRIIEHLGVEAGEIFLVEEGGKDLRMALHYGDCAEAFWTRDRFRIGEGLIGVVAETGEPLVNIDPKQEVRYLRQAVVEAGFNWVTLLPIKSRNKVVGVLGVASRKQRQMDAREVQVLQAISSWAGITIENARLHRQARRLAVLEERERIGMDLHDGIIQSIYGVGLALDYARLSIHDDPEQARQKIDQSIQALNATIRDIRTYILDLRPRQFQGKDICQSLERLVEEFRINSGIQANLVAPDNGLTEFPAENAMALFHIAQEALANTAKHSRAKKADIHVWTSTDRVLLEVTDDGRGFDMREMNTTLGHGLSNMQSRARKVGGDVEISSEPGQGTTVIAWVPRQA